MQVHPTPQDEYAPHPAPTDLPCHELYPKFLQPRRIKRPGSVPRRCFTEGFFNLPMKALHEPGLKRQFKTHFPAINALGRQKVLQWPSAEGLGLISFEFAAPRQCKEKLH